MKGLLAVVTAAGFVSVGLCAEPQAWPRFRGPNGSGVADGQKPPVEFGPDKNVKWKVACPSGISSPVVAGDLLVLTAFEDGKLYTVAFRRADGKEAWRADARAKQIEKYYKGEGSPAASTPATDGKRIISYFGSCGLICYDLSGKELWRYELPPVRLPTPFGSGVSPDLVDGTVILVRDEVVGARILALDATTGSLKWEKKRLSPVSYCTPVVCDTPTGKLVVAGGHVRLTGYDLGSGEERWFAAVLPSSTCASPVVANGTVFFAGSSGPTGADDKPQENMPTFDDMLKKQDKDKDGAISREESGKEFQEFFDSVDANKDGKITRDEWDAVVKFMTEGKDSAFALKLGGSGDVTKTNVLWKKTKGLPYVATAIVYRGQMVVVKDGGLVTAFDAKTGNPVYERERVAAPSKFYYASPVAANGYIYLTALENGAITVLKAGSDKPVVAAKNPSLGERTSATPAIADDTLYVRTEGHLYAFAERP